MRVRVELLGRFQVTVDGRAVSAGDWRRARSVALVKLLALAPGHRMHREQAMDALWPELLPDAAAGNLRKATHYARRTIGAHDVIKQTGEILALAPGADLEVDASAFEAAAQAALKSGDALACQRAADLYGGDLLPDDLYAEWAEEPRERLRQLHARVLKVGRLWERILEADPTDEEAQRAVMQAALDAGNRGEVIRQFQRLRERLRVDLGLGPSRATVAIYERALAPAPAEEPTSVVDRVRALLAWGIVHLSSGDFAEADRMAREARALSLEAGLAREMGEASALVGMVAQMQGRWLELFRSEFGTWIRQEPADVTNIFDGQLCLAEFCLCGPGGHEAIADAARELLATAEDEGSVEGRALATLILGEAELFSGRLSAAEGLLTDADRLHLQADAASGRTLSLQRLGEVALARGQKWRAGRLLQKGQKVAESSWLTPHLAIRLQALAVEAAPSTARAMEAIAEGDRLLAGGVCRPCSMGFRVAASMALAEAGELESASRRLDDTERLAGMWQGGPWVAAVWEARGEIRHAQGRPEQAVALLQEAAVRYGELGRPAEQARCHARAAALAARLGGTEMGALPARQAPAVSASPA